jgi:stage III sporulation protein AG
MFQDGKDKGFWRFNREQLPRVVTLLILALIGIVLISAGNLFTVGNRTNTVKTAVEQTEPPVQATALGNNQDETVLEERLQACLGQIAGVGDVKVMVLLASGPEYKYAVNTNTDKHTVEEKENTGRTQLTTEYNEQGQLVMARSPQDNSEKPVVTSEIKPKVQGVLVVAEGAADLRIRTIISEAVQTLLKISACQVSVFPKESR